MKAVILTRGGLETCRETKGSARDSEGYPEVSRGHIRIVYPKGRTCNWRRGSTIRGRGDTATFIVR